MCHPATDYAHLFEDIDAMLTPLESGPYWAVIHPSGRVSFVHGKPTVAELQDAVGGYIETIPHGRHRTFTAFCHESGKLVGLAPNPVAMRFLRWTSDMLVGPVVLIGPADPYGDETPLPADIRLSLAHEVIEA